MRPIVVNALIAAAGVLLAGFFGIYLGVAFPRIPMPLHMILCFVVFLVAWDLAIRIRPGNKPVTGLLAKRPRSRKTLIGLVALIILMAARTLLFQPFSIASAGNKPTLFAGDYVLVAKYAYGYSRYSLPFAPPLFDGRLPGAVPERGTVVVFRLPRDNSIDYILRIVGLPGERVQMIDGVLHIDGQPVKRERIPDLVEDERGGQVTSTRRWRETLPNGVSHATLELAQPGAYDSTPEYVVPPRHYFLMGDNRHNIVDSRAPGVGYVPLENIIGPVRFILWPNIRQTGVVRSPVL